MLKAVVYQIPQEDVSKMLHVLTAIKRQGESLSNENEGTGVVISTLVGSIERDLLGAHRVDLTSQI